MTELWKRPRALKISPGQTNAEAHTAGAVAKEEEIAVETGDAVANRDNHLDDIFFFQAFLPTFAKASVGNATPKLPS